MRITFLCSRFATMASLAVMGISIEISPVFWVSFLFFDELLLNLDVLGNPPGRGEVSRNDDPENC